MDEIWDLIESVLPTLGRASDSMMGPNIKLVDLFKLVRTGLSLVCCMVIRGSTGGFLLLRFSVVLFHTMGFSRCHITFLSSPHL